MSQLLLPHATSVELQQSPIALLRPGDCAARLDRAERRGEVTRVARGVYADTTEWSVLAPWQRYLARVHGVALVHPDAVFVLESAAALSGLPVYGEPPDVHVLGTRYATARVSADWHTHATTDARALIEVGGILMTEPAETAVDIARHRHPGIALAVADAVAHSGAGTPEILNARNEARGSSRGRRQARWPLRRTDGAAESPLESTSRAVVEWLGFPAPIVQAAVRTPNGERHLDFMWPRERVGGEADGRLKYDGRYGDPTNIVFTEKRREDSLRRSLSGFARWGWQELTAYSDLRDILRAAGLREERPPHLQLLQSLRRALTGAPRLNRDEPR